ncbi:VCBS repeat-containing protein [Streptomyces wuyuanensis]|uniref:VCBS repeat-containing protein n=1 Tax=Streptomyces wuyuanensis TaxID=1196353 RepID=UPI0034238202
MFRFAFKARDVRRAGAIALSLCVVGGLGPLSPGAAYAAAAPDAVIPAVGRPIPRSDALLAAGTTGFLHRQEGAAGYTWTSYDGANGEESSIPAATDAQYISATSTDTVAVYRPAPEGGGKAVALYNQATGAITERTLPGNALYAGVFGSKVVVVENPGTSQSRVLLLDAMDPAAEPVPVTGLPLGARPAARKAYAGDAESVVVAYTLPSGKSGFGLVDLSSGALTPVPGPTSLSTQFLLSDERIGWVTSGTRPVAVVPRDDPAAAPVTHYLPDGWTYRLAFAGDRVLATEITNEAGSYWGQPVLALPTDDTTGLSVLAHSAGPGVPDLLQAPGGTALAVGGDDAAHWAVRRLDNAAPGGGDGVLPLPALPSKVVGLTMARGLLRTVESSRKQDGSEVLALYNHDVGVSAVPQAGAASAPKSMESATVRCQAGSECVRLADGNSYGVASLIDRGDHVQIRTGGDESSGNDQDLTTDGGRILDASLGHVLVESGTPAQQYAVDMGHGAVDRVQSVRGAALSYSTLWSTSVGTGVEPGTLNAFDLDRRQTVRTLKTGTKCSPSELQVAERWLYWSCGAGRPSGVLDLSKGTSVAVPSGPAILGNGFVVRHDRAAGRLLLTDVHTGVAGTERKVADLPAGPVADERGITWTLDEHAGHLAYLGADQSVRVRGLGVAGSAPAARDVSPDDMVAPREPSNPWFARLFWSRPVESWKVTIARKAGGRQMAAFTGGPERRYSDAIWNGRESNGAPAPSGRYTWKATVTTYDSSVQTVAASGEFDLSCGTAVLRSLDCDGYPDLLGHKADGKLHSIEGTPSGGFTDYGYIADWPTTSRLVPFGDIDADGDGDLLVRESTGTLRAYLGFGQVYFSKTENASVLIGSGWNQYTDFLVPGDLTRDGHTDLVVRDTKGDMWLYAGTGKKSFKPRVKIGARWTAYPKVFGAGDITGDGIGDILAVDKSNQLWRYDGSTTGSVKPRVLVFGNNWAVNRDVFIGVGDITGDGKADLLSRRPTGELLRNAGNGAGSFGSTVKIATGWQRFKGLF